MRGDNVQANVTSVDYVQQFPGFRPFVRATQSEVYNNSVGIHVGPNHSGPGLVVDRVQLSGFAASDDGGRTWTNSCLPPTMRPRRSAIR